jgi:hypothetical protein
MTELADEEPIFPRGAGDRYRLRSSDIRFTRSISACSGFITPGPGKACCGVGGRLPRPFAQHVLTDIKLARRRQ